MKNQLFKNTSVKLAATYLLVVLVVSGVFSLSLYRILGDEIERNYLRSMDFADRFVGFTPENSQKAIFVQNRQDEHDVGKQRLVNQLLVINLCILGVGGVLCYLLARRTLEPIEEAHEALERFTSDASHELRTPLTTMRTEIEVALMNDKLTVKDARNLLQSNLEEVDRLTHLSERLLLLARLEDNELPKEKVSMVAVVTKAIDLTQTLANAKKITLVKKLPKQSELFVYADSASLTELVVILLDNAVKYSASNSSVLIKMTRSSKCVQLAVSDEGVGIAKEQLPYIFERFYRADTSRTGGEVHGYGLGLALAQKIALLHQGTITVQSKHHQGSTFTVTMPLV